MITLTRLSGSRFVLNSDLIERIDCTPDTVVSLLDGKKYVVAESLEQIVHAVRAYRSEIVALSSLIGPERAEPPAQTGLTGRPGRPSSGSDVPGTRLAPIAYFPGTDEPQEV